MVDACWSLVTVMCGAKLRVECFCYWGGGERQWVFSYVAWDFEQRDIGGVPLP